MSEIVIPQGSSIADHRDTAFELTGLHVFGHGRGGVQIQGTDRETHQAGAPIEVTSEMLATTEFGDLNSTLIDLVTKLEIIYASVHSAKAAAMTTEAVRRRIIAAQQADQLRTDNETAAAKAAQERAEHEAAAQRAATAKAELDAQIEAKRAELAALSADSPAKQEA